MTNAVLMERLCALAPPSRQHLLTQHGVLVPASGLRPKVVPRQTAGGREKGWARELVAAAVLAAVGSVRLRGWAPWL